MTAPTFVAEYESAWDGGPASRAVSVTTAVGDVLVVGALTQNGNLDPATPTGGTGLTWTLQQSIDISNSWGGARIWTATATTAETFTLTVNAVGNGAWGFNCLRFSSSDGIGTSGQANASGAPSLAVTTTAANSAVALFVCGWNAADGTSRLWRTDAGPLTEQTYYRNVSWYTVYGGFHADTATAGAKTVGLTSPSEKYSIVAVEVLGTTDTPNAATTPVYRISGGTLVPMTVTML